MLYNIRLYALQCCMYYNAINVDENSNVDESQMSMKVKCR